MARAAGIDPEFSVESDEHLPFELVLLLHEAAAKELKDDAFGIKKGYSAPIGHGKSFDYIGVACSTFGTAIANWVRFQNLPTNAVQINYSEDDQYAYMAWEVSDSFGPRAQLIGALVGFMLRRFHYICDGQDVAFQVGFCHKAPRNEAGYRTVCGPSVLFEQEEDRVAIPLEALSIVPPSGETNLLEIIEQSALHELRERGQRGDQLFILSNEISKALREGDASLDRVARNMGMSQRSLQRTLEASRTNYRSLVDDVRRSLAERYLKEADVQLSEIAFILGYSELSAFSRAAKGWFGVSAREFRRRAAF